MPSSKPLRPFRAWICSKTGHWFNRIETTIFLIKTNDLNRDMTAKIRCRCCGETFVHKDAQN